jgi:hypothetical protein
MAKQRHQARHDALFPEWRKSMIIARLQARWQAK